MMSDEELEAIDDWRFKNRIATRSDAVRKLTKIGTLTDEWIDRAGQIIDAAQEKYLDKITRFADMHPESLDDIHEVSMLLSAAWVEVVRVSVAASELRSHGNVQEAIAAADAVLDRTLEDRAPFFKEHLQSASGDDK
ncbi:hypothetical protein [Agrobacterium cavarae]|uniref:hypothetical protein n=1 Tax=Agrobacterium cavarae TaxID=2528239 RepID=UPI00289EAB98|nr:hypothetical protein [Agrobacterium cavarae]